jgi:cholestenol delta-isomerase
VTPSPMPITNIRPAPAATQLHLVIKLQHRIQPELINYPDRTLCEHRSLEYFRCSTATIMSHWLVEGFWKYQLPQTANSEPATRHAMIALAKVHENVELQREGLPNDPRTSEEVIARRLQYARHHYNIAVSELARALHQRTDAEEVALMVCALFVIYNFIIGNFTAAVFHMHNGIEIMSRWKASKIGDRVLSEGSLEKNLITLFGRLSYGSRSLDDPVPSPEPQSPTITSFSTLQTAKASMHLLTQDGIRLVRIGAVLAHNPQAAERWNDLDIQTSQYLNTLSQWHGEFENLLTANPLPHSEEDKGNISVLRMNHLIPHIWIWAILHPPEASEPTSMLEHFLDLVDELYTKWMNGKFECPSRIHIFDVGVIPPLNFVARRSNSSSLRERAQKLLIKAAPLILIGVHLIPIPVPMGNLCMGGEYFVSESKAEAINLEMGVADVGEDGLVEIEVEPGATQIGISLKSKREGNGWEVRKDFAV